MPIISIILQPVVGELKAAYRPIVFVARATRTDATAKPPVVYCDIYVADVYYKTQEKTQYLILNSDNSDWQFDIQDACQEILGKKLANNPMTMIMPVAEIMKSVYCKFRSSGINSDGFIESEGTTPIQGIGSNEPVAGDGTLSNSFYVVNSTLQHDQNQNLEKHLSYHKKNSIWGDNTYPLSHRPNGYKISPDDTDVFPIIHLGANALQCLTLNYRLKGQKTFHSLRYCLSDTPPVDECIAVGITGVLHLPDGQVGVPYSYLIPLTGTRPITVSHQVKPSWMTIAIFSDVLSFTGTPTMSDTGVTVAFQLGNCSADSLELNNTIDIIPAVVIPRPSLVEISNTDTGAGGIRTQMAQVGTSVLPGNVFTVEVYSHVVSYTAVSGDTPADVATALRNAVNATSEASWDSAGSAPAHGTTGFPPIATASGDTITIVLNFVNSFAFNAQIN